MNFKGSENSAVNIPMPCNFYHQIFQYLCICHRYRLLCIITNSILCEGSKNKNQFVLSLRNISISSEKEQTRVRRPSSLRIPLVRPIFGPLPSAASVVMQDLLRKPNTEAAAQMVVENSDRVLVHLINIYDEDAAKS